jgi:hypothetical protein
MQAERDRVRSSNAEMQKCLEVAKPSSYALEHLNLPCSNSVTHRSSRAFVCRKGVTTVLQVYRNCLFEQVLQSLQATAVHGS